MMLRAAGIFLGSSIAALSSVTITSLSLGACASAPCSGEKVSATAGASSAVVADKKKNEAGSKFMPKFDGLRFIETLVTAHK